jgi:hypothetical protein
MLWRHVGLWVGTKVSEENVASSFRDKVKGINPEIYRASQLRIFTRTTPWWESQSSVVKHMNIGLVLSVLESTYGFSSLMMEAVRTSETSVDNHSTPQYNPEDSSEQRNRRDYCVLNPSVNHCLLLWIKPTKTSLMIALKCNKSN